MFEIVKNALSKEDFISLYESAGWGSPSPEAAETAIKNSYAVFSVKDGEKTAAMVRLLGDGAMAFFMKDLIVSPEYQGNGLGSLMLNHLMDFIESELKPGWTAKFQLMSAPGKEGFYRKQGLNENPYEDGGSGFTINICGSDE